MAARDDRWEQTRRNRSTLFRPWGSHALRELTEPERRQLRDARVEATRPIVSGVLTSGAVIVALTGVFEAVGAAPDIGYPWWIVELGALAIAGCALATWHIAAWPVRLVLTLLATVLAGVFMSIPVPGTPAVPLAVRTALFQLLPIALLALLARPVSTAAVIATVLALAVVRAALHGVPSAGAALYWLFTATSIGFGVLMGSYVTDFAVTTFRIRQRLRHQANTDELTGLANRAGWNRDAAEAYADAVRRGAALSFVFFDIDRFKAINDGFGHAAGDDVLQRLGAILRERLSPGAHAARLGGEEFVVLLIGQAPEAAEGFAQRVRAEFASATRDDYRATVSAGIAHRQTGEAMGALLRRADLALYEAKASGRDRLVVGRVALPPDDAARA